jgi:hypothetical protein
MMNAIRNSSRLVFLLFILTVFASGCKSKKKAMEAARAQEERARLEQEAKARQQQEEEAKRKEAEERARREAELKANIEKAPKTRVSEYFSAIANSTSTTSANSSINEALTLFASPDTPVLIVISESNGQKDYDRPTTIREYLNYLKDTKKSMNDVSNMQVDSAGKITELELKKNY